MLCSFYTLKEEDPISKNCYIVLKEGVLTLLLVQPCQNHNILIFSKALPSLLIHHSYPVISKQFLSRDFTLLLIVTVKHVIADCDLPFSTRFLARKSLRKQFLNSESTSEQYLIEIFKNTITNCNEVSEIENPKQYKDKEE